LGAIRDGTVVPIIGLDDMKTLFILLLIYPTIISSQIKWQKTNGPSGGAIAALITKGDTVIAGTGYDKALIFFSTNKGINWTKAEFKTSYPHDQSRANDFIFTNDGGIISAVSRNGIYKSFDLIHWDKIYNNSNEFFWSLGKDFKGNLYAGTADDGNLFISKDNGSNWSIITSLGTGRISGFLLTRDSSLYLGSHSKVLKKNNNSDLWETIIFPDDQYYNLCSDTSNNIYAFPNDHIYISTNMGLTWASRDTDGFLIGNSMYHCIYNNKLIAALGDQTSLFGNGWGIALSEDQGKTWRWSNNGLPPQFSACFCLAKSNIETYVGTNAAGVYKSTNFGDSWFPINNGLNAADTRNINFDNKGNLYAACWSNGFFKSTDKGLSWKTINNGLTNVYCYSIIADINGDLLSGTDRGIFRSTDKGENWNLTNSAGNNFAYRFYRDRYNRIYAINYGDGIYRTTDLGTNWQRIDDGFGSLYVFGFVIDQNDNIYAGTRGGNIYKSTNDGSSWTEIRNSNSIYNSVIANISIAPNGNIFATNIEEGVIRSTDSGQSWNVLNIGITNPQVSALGINNNGDLFVSTLDGYFYYSSDNGESWQNILYNLEETQINDIIFDQDDTMYIATDESVWRSNPDTTVNVKDKTTVIKQYSLSQNYPNPFNPNTQINYTVKDAGSVKIEVFDILGRKVESLVNELKQPGNYSVTFNAKSITSGVYFYKLEINDYTSVKKMMFLK